MTPEEHALVAEFKDKIDRATYYVHEARQILNRIATPGPKVSNSYQFIYAAQVDLVKARDEWKEEVSKGKLSFQEELDAIATYSKNVGEILKLYQEHLISSKTAEDCITAQTNDLEKIMQSNHVSDAIYERAMETITTISRKAS